MKSFFFSIVFFFTFYQFSQAQNVTIPDENFKNAIINHVPSIDSNSDGEIQLLEAQSYVDVLNVSYQGITSLEGIENFTALKGLICTGNTIPTINLASNVALEILNISYTKPTELDISANMSLKEFYCDGNSLTELDLSSHTALNLLSVQSNQFSTLDITSNINLVEINCGYNLLTELNTSFNTELTVIKIPSNSLSELSILQNKKLEELYCNSNSLSGLYTTENTSLRILNINSNSISALDLTQNINLNDLNISSNPLLAILNISGNPNLVKLNATYCTNLTNVSFVNNPLLEEISLWNSTQTSIDVSQNPKLKVLNLRNLQLTHLDVSNNPVLFNLIVRDNPISNLDVSLNTNLSYLSLGNLNVIEMNISNNPNLVWFYVFSSRLKSINAKNGTNDNFSTFRVYSSPSLTAICVDDVAYAETRFTKPTTAYYSNKCKSECTLLALDSVESFEFTPEPYIDVCWSTYPFTNSSYNYVKSINLAHNGDQSISMRSSYTVPALLISPELEDFSNNKRISFWVLSGSQTNLEVGTMTDSNDNSTFTSYSDIGSNDSEGNIWREYHVDFKDYEGTDSFIAFRTKNYAITRLDDISYLESPSCIEPKLPIINYSHSTEVQVDWTDYNNASEWDIEYGLKNFELGTGTLITSVTKPYNIEGLLASTEYDFYVRAKCTASDVSDWSQLGVFTTRCEAKPVGYYYAFEDEYPTDYNSCWVSDNSYVNSFGGGYNETSKKYLNINSYQIQDIVVTPELENLDNTKRIKFWVNNTNGDSGFSIGTITNPGDLSTFTAYKSYPSEGLPENEWTKVVLHFDNYLGTDKYIAIRHDVDFSESSNHSMKFDAFTYEEIPSCLEPNNVIALEILDRTASIEWNEQASANEWEVEFGETDFLIGEGIVVETQTTNTIISGLFPDSNYDIYVRSKCGTEFSEWTDVFSIETTCGPIDKNYFQSFNTSEIANCWSTFSSNPITISNEKTYADDGYSVSFYENTLDTPVYLISPEFNDLGTTNNRIRFWINALHNRSNLIIGTMSDPLDENSFAPFKTIEYSEMPYRKWEQYTVNLDTYTGNDRYIAFKMQLTGHESSIFDLIYFDQFEYSSIPSCNPPTAFNFVDMTDGEITLNWQENNGATAWEIEYGEKDFWQGEGSGTIISASNSTTTISGLALNQDYDFYLRSKCNDDNYSDWSQRLIVDVGCGNSITTGYTYDFNTSSVDACWTAYEYPAASSSADFFMSSYRYRGDSGYSARLTASSTYSDLGVLLVSPMISDLTTAKKIKFWFIGDDYSFTVGTMSNPNDYESFTPLVTLDGTESSSVFEERTVYLDDYNGKDKYIAFKQKKSYNRRGESYIDDFSYLESVDCTELVNYNISNISEQEATLSWESTGPETEWEINYRIEGESDDNSTSILTTDKNYTLTDLIGDRSYQIKVRAVCNVGLFSDWSSEIISTPCDIGYPGYIESFELEGQLNPCWTTINSDSNIYTKIIVLENYSSGDKGVLPVTGNQFIKLENRHDTDGPPSDFLLVSKELYDLDDKKRIKFNLISHQDVFAGSYYNRSSFQIGVMSDPNDASSFELIQTITPEEMSVYKFVENKPVYWKEHTIFLDGYTGNGKYIALKNGDEFYGSQFYIDDFAYEAIPECTEPLYPKVLDEHYNRVDIAWETYENSSPELWEIQYGFSGFLQGEGTTIEATNDNITINNLIGDTEYDFYIRAKCGDAFSDWSVKTNFKTDCEGFGVGYFENFDSQDTGFVESCWRGLRPTNTNQSYWDQSLNNVSVVNGNWSISYDIYSEPNVVRMLNEVNHPDHDAVSDKIDLVSPRLIDLDNYKKISFYLNPVRSAYASPAEIVIGTLSNPDDYTTFTPFYSITDAYEHDGEWKKYEINLSDYYLTDEYIGIKQVAKNERQVILIDDFEYSENECIIPTSLEAFQSNDIEVTLSWQDNNTKGAPESWEIEYGPIGFDQGEGTIVQTNSNPHTLSNLDSFTDYDFYVRAYCNIEKGYSPWSTVYAFNISCYITAPFYESFDQYDISTQYQDEGIPQFCWKRGTKYSAGLHNTDFSYVRPSTRPNVGFLNYTDHNSENILLPGYMASPYLSDFDNTKMIKIWLRNDYKGSEYHRSGVVIGTMSNPLDRTTFTAFKSIAPEEIPLFGKEFEIDFSNYIGTDKHIVIMHDETYENPRVYFDDFYYLDIPECKAPIEFKVAGISNNTVSLVWEENELASGYQVEYGQKGFVKGSGTIVTSQENKIAISGLTHETAYEFYLRSDCGSGKLSEWIGPKEAITTCGITAIPWVENFDSMASYGKGVLPECFIGESVWESSNVNLSAYQVGDNDSHFLHVTYDNYSLKTSLITPMFYLEAGTTYNLAFKIRKEAGDYSSQGVTIKTGLGNTHELITTSLNRFSGYYFGFYDYYPVETAFTPVESGNYTFGLYFSFSSTTHTLVLDSLSLDTAYDSAIELEQDTPLVVDFESSLASEIILETTEQSVNEIVFDDAISNDVVNMRLSETLDDWVETSSKNEKWTKNQNGINKVDFEVDANNVDELFMNFSLKQAYHNTPEESVFRVVVNGQVVLDNVYAPISTTSKNGTKSTVSEYRDFEIDLSDYSGQKLRISMQQLGRHYDSETSSDEAFLNNLSFNGKSSLSTENNVFANLVLYPNPVNEVLYLKNNNRIEKIEIHNLVGQKVYSAKVDKNETEINLSGLPLSIYLVTVYSNNLKNTYKVVKE